MASELQIAPEETTYPSAITLFLPPQADSNADREFDRFWELCVANPDLRFERNADGSIVVMTPSGFESGRRSGRIVTFLNNWNDLEELGVVGDSSSGFRLPDNSAKSPDASWVLKERIDALSQEERERYAPIVPDFVVEVRSPSDKIRELRTKMREYIEQGVRLAWLIDPKTRLVEIYRPGQKPVKLENPTSISGDPELPGFVLEMSKVW